MGRSGLDAERQPLRLGQYVYLYITVGYLYGMGWKLPAISVVAVVVTLTVGGATAGLALHGPWGVLVGAVPGALAGVAAGFVPGFRDRAEKQLAEAEKRREEAATARRFFDAAGEPKVRDGKTGPAALLRPERAVVDFTGRTAELGLLREWCGGDAVRSVWAAPRFPDR